MKSNDPLSLYVEEELAKVEAVKPETLKKELDTQRAELSLLTRKVRANVETSVGGLREMLAFQYEKIKAQEKRLQEQDRLISNLQAEKIVQEQAIATLQTQLGDLDRKSAEEHVRVVEDAKSISAMQAEINDLEHRIFGTDLPKLEFTPLERSQGGYVLPMVGAPPLGRIWYEKHWKDVLNFEPIYSIYPDDVGPSSLATVRINDLSILQQLHLIQFGMTDSPDLAPATQTPSAIPPSEPLSKFNKDLAKK